MLMLQNKFEVCKHQYLQQLLNDEEIDSLNSNIQLEFDSEPITNHFARGPVKMIYQPDSAKSTSEKICDYLQNHLNLELCPTFWYSTQYYNGAFMLVHRDRPACEISVSLNISGDMLWDLYLKDKNDCVHGYKTPPGDAVLYSGSELLHWRTHYEGQCYTQAFFNYVTKDGPNTRFSHDPPQNLVPW
jgi:hypothetical protein